jgi:hypothetical protein
MTDPDAIARRAYELYLSRGSEPGHEMEDWLQAEAQLKAESADDEEHRSTQAGGEESEAATDQERRAPRKRNGSSRRVARQPHTP